MTNGTAKLLGEAIGRLLMSTVLGINFGMWMQDVWAGSFMGLLSFVVLLPMSE